MVEIWTEDSGSGFKITKLMVESIYGKQYIKVIPHDGNGNDTPKLENGKKNRRKESKRMSKADLEYGDLVFRVERVCKGVGEGCKVICKDCTDYKYEINPVRFTKEMDKKGLDNIYLTVEDLKRSLIEGGVKEEDIILNL